MGHALDTQVFSKINSVYGNLKDQLKLDLCICETLSYVHGTMETTFVGVAIITTNIKYLRMAEQKTFARYQTCYANLTEGLYMEVSGRTSCRNYWIVVRQKHHQQAYLLPESFDIPWQAIHRAMSDHFV